MSFRRRLHDPDYPATWLPSLRKVRFPSDLVRDYDHWISGGFDEVDLEALLPGLYRLLPKFALAVYAIRCLDDEYAPLEQALVNSAYSTPSDFEQGMALVERLASTLLAAHQEDLQPSELIIGNVSVALDWDKASHNREIQEFLMDPVESDA